MRALRHWGLLAAIAVACVVLPAAAAGTPLGADSALAPAANEVTFTDSQGENPQAPDIGTIVVGNNDAGVVSFRVNILNRPQLGQDMLIVVYVDTDNNVQTGSADFGGADYVIEVVRGEINLFRWDGTDYTRRLGDPSAVTLSFSYANGITIRIAASELGNTKAFKFFVVVLGGIVVDPTTGDLDFTNAQADAAPGGGAGLYPFEVKITPPTLLVRRFTPAPKKPTAGKNFSLRLQAARSDTGALIQGGRVTCVGRIGNSRLRTQSAGFVGRQAVCTWAIPAGAKKKLFRGTVTIAFEGLKVTRSFSGRVG